MGTILLLLLIFFVIIPLFRVSFAIYKARRSARRFFDQFRSQAEGQRNPFGKTPEPEQKRKKINPEDGEFVAFEELPDDNTGNASDSNTKVVVEQQIVDVEWEDIK